MFLLYPFVLYACFSINQKVGFVKVMAQIFPHSSRSHSNTANSESGEVGSNHKLYPWFVTGFTDCEGCFSVSIEITSLTNWKVRPSFVISLHLKDIEILKRILFWRHRWSIC